MKPKAPSYNLPVGYVPFPVEPTREILQAVESAEPGAYLSLKAYAAIVKAARDTYQPEDRQASLFDIEPMTMAKARASSAYYSGLALRDLLELLPVVQGDTPASAAAVKRAREKLLASVVEHADDILEALRVAASTLETANDGA
jgi:hypothetical protein